MAEVIAKDGAGEFDGEIIRIIPGRDREVHQLRQLVGEVTVPLPHPYAPADAVPGGPGHEPAAPQPPRAEPAGAVPVKFRKEPEEEPEAVGAASGSAVPGDDHDAVLRRLGELGELHAAGVLTDEEFAAAKRAILQRMGGNR